MLFFELKKSLILQHIFRLGLNKPWVNSCLSISKDITFAFFAKKFIKILGENLTPNVIIKSASLLKILAEI